MICKGYLYPNKPIFWGFYLQEVEKPAPIKISVSELLAKVQKPQKKIIKQGLATVEKNCKYRVVPISKNSFQFHSFQPDSHSTQHDQRKCSAT